MLWQWTLTLHGLYWWLGMVSYVISLLVAQARNSTYKPVCGAPEGEQETSAIVVEFSDFCPVLLG